MGFGAEDPPPFLRDFVLPSDGASSSPVRRSTDFKTVLHYAEPFRPVGFADLFSEVFFLFTNATPALGLLLRSLSEGLWFCFAALQ